MGHGGQRINSGRKPKPKRAVRKVLAEAILESIDELAAWQDLLSATTVTSVLVIQGGEGDRENISVPDYNIRFKALQYLTNRRDGMPAQSVKVEDERPALGFGNIPMPTDTRTVSKPN